MRVSQISLPQKSLCGQTTDQSIAAPSGEADNFRIIIYYIIIIILLLYLLYKNQLHRFKFYLLLCWGQDKNNLIS